MHDSDGGFAVAIALVIGFGLGFVLSALICGSSWERQCIQRGVAEYDKTTGSWQWTVQPIATPTGTKN